MTPIDIIEHVYREAAQPVPLIQELATELRYWYQAFPAHHYLQPCVIDGKAALVCQKHLSDNAPKAYRALKAICAQYAIYLKQDSRANPGNQDITYNRRKVAVILTFCLTMGSNAYAANIGKPSALATATALLEPQAVSMAFENQTLSDAIREIADRTGIRFKVDAPIENDVINQKLAAPNWKSALNQLLQNYNYTTIHEGNAIKTVLISGYKGGIKPSSRLENLAEQSADSSTAPQEDASDHEAIIDIAIPTDELSNLPEGGDMNVDLPVGTFNIKQESMVAIEDGTSSWVGTMDDENQFYRLYLTRSQDGEVVGNVFTPNGTFNIQTINGQPVMIEVSQVSMR
jgi:hypothetical protein